ncbi:MAG: exodeoxyribonuclease V subunit alpha [Vibrio sp.]
MISNPQPQQESGLLSLLVELEKRKVIRAIDQQFALFIEQQISPSETAEVRESLVLLACLLSFEYGRGNVCLNLADLNVMERLSLRYVLLQHPELKLQFSDLFERWAKTDWLSSVQQHLQNSSCIISVQTQAQGDENRALQALPLTFENDDTPRLYLTRYWHYETQVAKAINARTASLPMNHGEVVALKNTLNELFARDYSFLFRALNSEEYKDEISRQRLVCEMLDVVESNDLDWPQIDTVLLAAKKANGLQSLDHLVPQAVCLNWQKVAAAVALTRQFSVISGGPGTGKTTTVAKLLAALITQSLNDNSSSANHSGDSQEKRAPIIQLVAPTGKAAARLTESIGQAIDQLPVSNDIKALMPAKSSTIHRLLGARFNTVEYKYNASNPLHLDILVVDEASMVDLPMMFRLLQALPSHARLILLGDKDQLASVEAGAILSEICRFSSSGYQADYHQTLSTLTGFDYLPKATANQSRAIADSLCMLQKSYRFHARSGVGNLAKAINESNHAKMSQVWKHGFKDIQLHAVQGSSENNQDQDALAQNEAQATVCKMMAKAYQRYCQLIQGSQINQNTQTDLFAEPDVLSKLAMEQRALSILKEFAQARLLCAVRQGEFGVERMNSLIESALTQNKLLKRVEKETWYAGRPIMVTQNDSALGLHNGDIGICLLDESEPTPKLRVFFDMPDGSIKGILPSRVPKHDLSFAMTIHKSQGSEFEHTVMVLPNKMNQILTKELIYTGVTRAKTRLDLFANPAILSQGVSIKTQRFSGLSDKLS